MSCKLRLNPISETRKNHGPKCKEKKCHTRPTTYHIKQIVVSIVKMLIKIVLRIEGFFAVPTSPFIYIHMDFMLLLIPVQVIFMMKPTAT